MRILSYLLSSSIFTHSITRVIFFSWGLSTWKSSNMTNFSILLRTQYLTSFLQPHHIQTLNTLRLLLLREETGLLILHFRVMFKMRNRNFLRRVFFNFISIHCNLLRMVRLSVFIFKGLAHIISTLIWFLFITVFRYFKSNLDRFLQIFL